MNPFTKSALEVIQAIPPGRVATYGQVASLAGHPRAARQVARILHSMSKKYNLPWHRVVNAKGKIVISDEETAYEQCRLLKEEQIVIEDQQINLEKYQWKPLNES